VLHVRPFRLGLLLEGRNVVHAAARDQQAQQHHGDRNSSETDVALDRAGHVVSPRVLLWEHPASGPPKVVSTLPERCDAAKTATCPGKYDHIGTRLGKNKMTRPWAGHLLAVGLIALTPALANDAVTARQGVVVAQEARAARIGVEVLQQGGNAVDAAVATAF